MGKLRFVPKTKAPGFLSFHVTDPGAEKRQSRSHLAVVMPGGTVVEVSQEMSLRQIARFVKLLEADHGLG